tara:strand:+ start:265 stop:1086 length:822 start_codon:yes stop_codon:yes gene_type:complete
MTSFGYNVLGFGAGGSAGPVTLESQTAINGQSNYKEVVASNFIKAGGTLIIPTDFWVWSDAGTYDSTPALVVDVVGCTIENYGKIIARGGNGGGTAAPGLVAIKINSGITGVTIINASGSYIAGGGGGGGRGQNGQGGGGAGGADNGNAPLRAVLNAAGANGWYGGQPGYGGGAGGGGAGFTFSGAGAGGGGGRILPGSGGSGNGGGGAGGAGGSAGSNGSNPRPGGGGGWGANGGTGYYNGAYSGGSGGKAIDPTGNSYTLSNSGTVYGATS